MQMLESPSLANPLSRHLGRGVKLLVEPEKTIASRRSDRVQPQLVGAPEHGWNDLKDLTWASLPASLIQPKRWT